MISKLYLNRASQIRKEYLQILTNIDSYENIARELVKSLELRKSEFEKLLSDINSKKISNIEEAKQHLHDLVLKTEADMNSVDSQVNKLNSRIDKLREEETNLFKDLKITYSDIPEDTLKKEIQEHIKSLNLS
jgi:uncharacterized protein Yka (UPF0111/DUF47 family)